MKRSILIAAALAAAPLTSAFADVRTWTGAGDGISWNDPINWDGGIALPVDGDSIVFPDVLSGQAVDTQANRIIGALTFNAPDAYVVNNNQITLGGTNTQGGTGPVTL